MKSLRNYIYPQLSIKKKKKYTNKRQSQNYSNLRALTQRSQAFWAQAANVHIKCAFLGNQLQTTLPLVGPALRGHRHYCFILLQQSPSLQICRSCKYENHGSFWIHGAHPDVGIWTSACVAHTDRGKAGFCFKVEFANAKHQAAS